MVLSRLEKPSFEQESKRCFCKKIIPSYKQEKLILVTVNDCLSDTHEKAKSLTNSSLPTIRKDNLNKRIFAYQ